MPDFDTRRPRQQEEPSQLRIASITNKIRTMLVAAKLRGALIASKLRTTLLASRLRILLIGGGIYLFVVAVPVGLLIYSPSWLGNQQQKVVDKASNDDNPLVACAADRGSQQSFVLSYQNDLWTMSLNGSNLIPVIYTASASIHGGTSQNTSRPGRLTARV
jgi:hypothetical protein